MFKGQPTKEFIMMIMQTIVLGLSLLVSFFFLLNCYILLLHAAELRLLRLRAYRNKSIVEQERFSRPTYRKALVDSFKFHVQYVKSLGKVNATNYDYGDDGF